MGGGGRGWEEGGWSWRPLSVCLCVRVSVWLLSVWSWEAGLRGKSGWRKWVAKVGREAKVGCECVGCDAMAGCERVG